MAEERENGAKKAKPKNGSPYAFMGIIIMVIIAAGIAAYYYSGNLGAQNQNNSSNANNGNNANGNAGSGTAKVQVTLVYSAKCTVCDKSNSALLLLDQKSIPYEIKAMDAEWEEGKKIVAEYGISVVPTALVDINALALYSATNKAFARQFRSVNGKYVIPESFIDGIPRQTMFLKPQSEECTAQSGFVTVDEFFDFSCASCNAARKEAEKMKRDMNSEMLFRNRNYVLRGEPSERLAVAYECAKLGGKGEEFMEMAFDGMFGEKTPLRDLISIDQNTREYYVSDEEKFLLEITGIAKKIGVQNIPSFNKCYLKDETIGIAGKNGTDAILGGKFGIKWVPTFVVDCQYVIPGADPVIGGKQSTIGNAVCLLHPELKACQKAQ